MFRPVVALTLALAMLSGCFGKDASRADMERQATEAIENFSQDVLPDGRLASVDISGWISVETQVNGFPFKAQLAPDVEILLGPAGGVLVDGTLASMRFTAYCDASHIVTVTQNTQQYGIPEGSVESRNPIGHCTGPGSEQLLLEAFEFELVDPVLLTGQLDVDAMTAVSFSDVGKDKVEAEYELAGPAGTTRLFVTVHGDKVAQIIADNVDSHLVMDMGYGERSPLDKPGADERVPSPVSGTTSVDDDGWRWRGVTREGGPIGEYSILVYENGTSVACGSAEGEPVVSFDLGGPGLQESSGWRLVISEDGDGRLGMGDELLVTPPSTIVADVDHVFVIWDDWADRNARDLGCATPGFGAGAGALGLLAALAVAMRRR